MVVCTLFSLDPKLYDKQHAETPNHDGKGETNGHVDAQCNRHILQRIHP